MNSHNPLSSKSRTTSPLRIPFSTNSRGSHLTTGLVLIGLLTLVGTATFITARANSERQSVAVRARTEQTIHSIEDRLSTYNEVLYGVRENFVHHEVLTRSEYHRIIERLDVSSRWPGVQVIGAAHLIDSTDLGAYQDELNSLLAESGGSYPNFAVHPLPTEPQVLPIDYIEPVSGNEAAFGLNFLSEENRRTAAFLARDTDKPATTGPITLAQETGEQLGFFVMLPIYHPGAELRTLTQRRDQFDGVVYAAFRMGDLMAGILNEDGPSNVSVVDVVADQSLYGEMSVDQVMAISPTEDQVGIIQLSGRTWRVFVNDDQPVLSLVERIVPIATLLGGLFITVLFLALARSMRSARSQARKRADEMTVELDALTESANEAIVSVDAYGAIVAWNRGATEIFGATADAMMGQPSHQLVALPDRDKFAAIVTAATTQKSIGGPDRRLRGTGCRVTGAKFPAEMIVSSWSANGERFATGIIRDTTDRIEADRLIQETSDMLAGVLSAATEIAIVGTDTEGTITLFNSGAEIMLGYSAGELVGIETPAIFHAPDEVIERADELGIDPGFEVFVLAARSGKADTRQWTYIAKDGEFIPVELTVAPRYGESGQICGFIGLATDITNRLNAEAGQQLRLDHERELVAKLKELDSSKNDFVSTTSHELRTPLTSIIGFAELLADELDPSATTGDAVGMVGMIDKNAQRLLALVEDLLALSRFESGAFQIGRTRCDVDQILTTSIQAILPLAASRGIDLSFEIDTGAVVEGDPAQLERLFLNLLSNAVKFSRQNSTIEVVAKAGHALSVAVIDHGIGIPTDEQSYLFTRFFRARAAEERAIQGSGLGLSIVANIVEFHDGEIEIDSTENVGTTVTVTLPVLEHRPTFTKAQKALV